MTGSENGWLCNLHVSFSRLVSPPSLINFTRFTQSSQFVQDLPCCASSQEFGYRLKTRSDCTSCTNSWTLEAPYHFSRPKCWGAHHGKSGKGPKKINFSVRLLACPRCAEPRYIPSATADYLVQPSCLVLPTVGSNRRLKNHTNNRGSGISDGIYFQLPATETMAVPEPEFASRLLYLLYGEKAPLCIHFLKPLTQWVQDD